MTLKKMNITGKFAFISENENPATHTASDKTNEKTTITALFDKLAKIDEDA
jgi:hypothetical protein